MPTDGYGKADEEFEDALKNRSRFSREDIPSPAYAGLSWQAISTRTLSQISCDT